MFYVTYVGAVYYVQENQNSVLSNVTVQSLDFNNINKQQLIKTGIHKADYNKHHNENICCQPNERTPCTCIFWILRLNILS
jgi:hypothetical protein